MVTNVADEQISRFTVRTSGRRTFRRCYRKWGYESSMRMNLQRKGTETNINFWFGSAIHFAMEDYFGYNRFGDLQKAFQAYYAAFPAYERPEGADSHYFLGMGMLDYFRSWYSKHNLSHGFETVWLDENNQEVPVGTFGARPLVEEPFMLNLGKKVWVREDTGTIVNVEAVGEILYVFTDGNYYAVKDSADDEYWFEIPGEIFGSPDRKVVLLQTPVYYHGTLDRVVRDRQGRWWIMDWKTAKGADTNKLDTDDQISAYLWAAEQWFGHPIHGFVYVQLTKELPKPPKRLANGSLSVDKKQKTTHSLLRAEIIKDFGEVRKAPNKMIEFLNFLAEEETPEGDRFIRWDMVTRNQGQKVSTYYHIMGEVELMTDPNLYLYPNPTRDCIWDCKFRDACISTDKGEMDAAIAWLDANFEPRPRKEDGNIDPWRENIPWPDSERGEAVGTLVDEYAAMNPDIVLNLILPEQYRED